MHREACEYIAFIIHDRRMKIVENSADLNQHKLKFREQVGPPSALSLYRRQEEKY